MKKFTYSLIFAFIATLFLGSNAFGQITLRSSNTNPATGGTLTITKPTGLALNDVMIVSITQGETGSGSLSNATAAGWSLVQGASFGIDGTTSRQATILFKVANAADVAATDFVFTVSNPGNNDKTAGTLSAFYNVSPSAPIEVTGTWGTGSGTTVTAPEISTTSANAGLLMFAFTGDNTSYSSWTAPLSSVSSANNGADGGSSTTQDVAVGRGFGLQAVAGLSGNKTVTQSSDPWAGILIALKPATPVASVTPAIQTISTTSSIGFSTTTSFFPAGGSYTYAWTVTPMTGVTIPAGNSSTKNITFNSAGSFTVSVLVTHSTGPSATSNIATVNVAAPNSSIGCNGGLFISYADGTSGPNNTTSINQLAYNGSIFTPSPYSVNPTGIGFNGMGLNPVDGFIYAVRYPATGAAARLIKVGTPGVGNITDLGVIGGLANGETVYSGAFDANGDFFITVQNSNAAESRLMRIDAADITGGAPFTATQVGSDNSVYGTLADIAINPVTGQLVGTANGSAPNYLYPNINKTTGAPGTPIGGAQTGTTFFAGLFFNEAGSLFGYRSDGQFYGISTASGVTTSAGSTTGYANADGCNCSFRVGHTMTRGAFCPSAENPTPDFLVTMSLLNNSGAARTGITLTLDISDPNTRFRFVQAGGSTPASASTIASALFAANLLPNANASNVLLSTVAPATGTNYNKIVINNLIAPYPTNTLTDKIALSVEFYTNGGTYSPVNFQSVLSNLPAGLGSTDLSDNTSAASGPVGPNAPTIISFTDCGNINLPVQLISFSGVAKDGINRLSWVVEDEINFNHYELERSTDGRNFVSVNTTQATGSLLSQQYGYADNVLLTSEKIFYYRLKMVDLDGSYKYSNVILLRKDNSKLGSLVINPNPVIGESATVRFEATAQGKVEFRVVDMAGRVVLTQQHNVTEGANSVGLTKLDRLQPGIYVLQMNDGISLQTTKFVISQ